MFRVRDLNSAAETCNHLHDYRWHRASSYHDLDDTWSPGDHMMRKDIFPRTMVTRESEHRNSYSVVSVLQIDVCPIRSSGPKIATYEAA